MSAKWRKIILLAGIATCSITSAADRVSLQRADGKILPALVYAPSHACQGIAIISHGAGGSELGYGYLARFMASQDYLTVVPGHQESGLGALQKSGTGQGNRDALMNLVANKSAYTARLMDISAARQWAAPRCNGKAAILLGHSMGAATVMMVAGAENYMGIDDNQRKVLQLDSVFDRYVALSPQGKGVIFPHHAWSGIQRPVLMMTGTKDDSLGGGSWKRRTEAFADMPVGCKWLGVIDGATHMNFAGYDLSSQNAANITQTMTAFLRATPEKSCQAPAPTIGLSLSAK